MNKKFNNNYLDFVYLLNNGEHGGNYFIQLGYYFVADKFYKHGKQKFFYQIELHSCQGFFLPFGSYNTL